MVRNSSFHFECGAFTRKATKIILICVGLSVISTAWADQICEEYIDDEWPNIRYTDHGDGTVTDQKTQLMWKKCSEGLSGLACEEGRSSSVNWPQALAIPETLNATTGFAGYFDWRVPNIEEMRSLAAINCLYPAINEDAFPNTPESYFWSSSPTAHGEDTWVIDFDSGFDDWYERDENARVRLIRTPTAQ